MAAAFLLVIAGPLAAWHFFAPGPEPQQVATLDPRAAAPWVVVAPGAGVASRAVPSPAGTILVQTGRELPGQRANRLLKSARPEEQFAGYKLLARCVDAQRSYPKLVRQQPEASTQLFQAMNEACEGMDATLLGERMAILAKLMDSGVAGVAYAYARETPDGRDAAEVAGDPNYEAWDQKRMDYLRRDAALGDQEAIVMLAGIYGRLQRQGHEYDALAFQIAELEIFKGEFPEQAALAMADSKLADLKAQAKDALAEPEIGAAVAAGTEMGRLASKKTR